MIALLGGCGEADIATSRLNARSACLQQSFDLLGIKDEEPADENKMHASFDAFLKVPDSAFRIVSTGDFVFDAGRLDFGDPIPPYDLSCTGNINTRMLRTVQINSTLHRPKAEETWTF
jgi:hypothetical protein